MLIKYYRDLERGKVMDRYIEFIKEKNPSIIIEKYNFNCEGQNNDIVIINHEYVFKFPKYPEGIEKLKREIDVLDILNRYISLDIPKGKYFNVDALKVGQVYCGYKMIKGVSFGNEIYNNVEDKKNIAVQLATFLKQLHSIPVKEVRSCSVKIIDNRSEWESVFNRIQEKLFSFMKKESQELIYDNFNRFLNQNFKIMNTLIHGDFGPSNIIFDLDKQIISGIIDFNDVSIGDPASDIASLIGPFGYGKAFVKSFESIYPNIEELLQRAEFYASTFALQEALFGIEYGDKKAFNAGIKQYL